MAKWKVDPQIDPEWLGWIAGILEGEGCFYLRHRNGKIRHEIKVNMTDEDIVRRLEEKSGMGRVGGPYSSPSHGDHKPLFQWVVAQQDHVQLLIFSIWPFLGERRRAKIQENLTAAREVA